MTADDVMLQRRAQVVELVRSGQLGGSGDLYGEAVDLPDQFSDVSDWGEIAIDREPARHFLMVTFYERRGFIDQFEGVVYVEDPNHFYRLHELFASSTPEITTIAPNWYHVLAP